FSPVLLEITNTLKQPPKASTTMKTCINIGITTAYCFYISVASTGYASMGDAVPGEVLDGFTDAPPWVLIVANLAICVHMLSAFQVFAQPIFDSIESQIKAAGQQVSWRGHPTLPWGSAYGRHGAEPGGLSLPARLPACLPARPPAAPTRAPAPPSCLAPLTCSIISAGRAAMFHADTGAANEHVPLNDAGYFLPLWQRLVLRSAYVLIITLVAICMPFFTAVVGLVG
ncbi:hypothetical protein CHLNCDRAFT_24724, partial [Chlorella variabilis]